MTTILILIAVYLVSVIGNYKYTQISHFHKNGIYEGIYPDNTDFVFLFIPIFNTILLFQWILTYPIEKDWNKFFNKF